MDIKQIEKLADKHHADFICYVERLLPPGMAISTEGVDFPPFRLLATHTQYNYRSGMIKWLVANDSRFFNPFRGYIARKK